MGCAALYGRITRLPKAALKPNPAYGAYQRTEQFARFFLAFI
jgi:hypothetical protein